MTGPEHWLEAERLLALAGATETDPRDPLCVAFAQVHATLALVGAQIANACVTAGTSSVLSEWSVVSP